MVDLDPGGIERTINKVSSDATIPIMKPNVVKWLPRTLTISNFCLFICCEPLLFNLCSSGPVAFGILCYNCLLQTRSQVRK